LQNGYGVEWPQWPHVWNAVRKRINLIGLKLRQKNKTAGHQNSFSNIDTAQFDALIAHQQNPISTPVQTDLNNNMLTSGKDDNQKSSENSENEENNKLDTEIDACPTLSGNILNNSSQSEVGNDAENEKNNVFGKLMNIILQKKRTSHFIDHNDN
jgi:hypothetical protein